MKYIELRRRLLFLFHKAFMLKQSVIKGVFFSYKQHTFYDSNLVITFFSEGCDSVGHKLDKYRLETNLVTI